MKEVENANLELIELMKSASPNIFEYHPYDIALIYQAFDEAERLEFNSHFSPIELARIFEHLESEIALEYLNTIPLKIGAKILEAMDIEEAVDILKLLDEEEVMSYVSFIKKEEAKEIKSLLKYDEEVAGSIMSTSYIEIPLDSLVKDAMRIMIKEARDTSYINTLYVVDKKGVLMGIIGLKQLIIAGKEDKISEIMTDKIISANVMRHKEEVADLMQDYDIDAIPIVDNKNNMLGIITFDDVMDVITEESEEDYARLAGLSSGDIEASRESVFLSVKKRVPWLMILLVLNLFTSLIISGFEETIATVALLAMFMPLVLGMAGNTGTQSLAVTIRSLTEDALKSKKEISKHIFRETLIGFFNGIVVGIMVFLMANLVVGLTTGAFFTSDNIKTGTVIGASIMLTLAVSTTAGALVPLIFNMLKIDPALASGPLITTINDIVALTIYFGLATLLLL
ncbi:MAG: magnesium transporter [Bacilli bacterium]|nr:magnesium transporter [Bacilli bacterium]